MCRGKLVRHIDQVHLTGAHLDLVWRDPIPAQCLAQACMGWAMGDRRATPYLAHLPANSNTLTIRGLLVPASCLRALLSTVQEATVIVVLEHVT